MSHISSPLLFFWGKFLWFSIFPQRAKKSSALNNWKRKRKLNEQRRRHKIKWHYLKLFLMRKYMRQFESYNGKTLSRGVMFPQHRPMWFLLHFVLLLHSIFDFITHAMFAKKEDARLIFRSQTKRQVNDTERCGLNSAENRDVNFVFKLL